MPAGRRWLDIPAQRPIQVGSFPAAIAISPRGGTAYVANYGSDTVTPITLATETAVLDTYAGQVSLINTKTRHVFAADVCQLPHRQVPAATKAPRKP
jgi:DNA-binding beta-propeller fold protein YncE